MKSLAGLLSYLKEEDEVLAKEAALSVARYSKDADAIKIAQSILSEKINIDLWELESLVNPDKFKFPEPDVGLVGVEDEEVV